MAVTLDPQTEQRIQREIDLGHFRDADEVLAHAMALLEDEQDWYERNSEAVNARLETSLAEEQRGETYSPEEARRILADRCAARAA